MNPAALTTPEEKMFGVAVPHTADSSDRATSEEAKREARCEDGPVLFTQRFQSYSPSISRKRETAAIPR